MPKPDIGWKSRVLPQLGSLSEYCHNVWYRKTRMVVKNFDVYSFRQNTRTWQTDKLTYRTCLFSFDVCATYSVIFTELHDVPASRVAAQTCWRCIRINSCISRIKESTSWIRSSTFLVSRALRIQTAPVLQPIIGSFKTFSAVRTVVGRATAFRLFHVA